MEDELTRQEVHKDILFSVFTKAVLGLAPYNNSVEVTKPYGEEPNSFVRDNFDKRIVAIENSYGQLKHRNYDINDIKDEDGKNLLIQAVQRFYLCEQPVINMLIGYGISLEHKDKYEKTALDYALEKDNMLDIYKQKIESATSIISALDETIEENKTVLQNYFNELVKKDWYDETNFEGSVNSRIIKALTSKNLDFSYINERGETLLMQAVKQATYSGIMASKSYAIFTDLLEKAADTINAQDNKGRTALIKTVKYSKLEVVGEFNAKLNLCMAHYLIEDGADVNIKDYKGKTFIDYTKGKKAFKQLLNSIEKDYVNEK